MVNQMFDSGKGHGGCGSGEDLVGYVYGEMDETSKVAFEVHLEDCAFCAEELASFSSLRISIGEWKKSENAIERPSAAASAGTAGLLARFIDALSASFGVKALAGASIAVIILILGVIAFRFMSPDKGLDQIANVPPVEEKEAVIPAEPVSEPGPVDVADAGSVDSEPVAEQQPLPVSDERDRNRPRNSPVRKRSPQKQATVPPSQLAENNDPPRLSEAAEEEFEDDSLRLTDLFGEIGED